KHAILAAEDSRFYEHGGVDPVGVVRALMANLSAGTITQGSSTLTMQLAREFFLSPERTYARKITEALLALRIEDTLTKDEILELYINQIFLGKRAYGFAAAARTYFDKPLSEINAAEAAMLAGLPKAPSRFNPFANRERATERQRYILRRMRENNFLTEEQYRTALETPLKYATPRNGFDDESEIAPYVAELASRPRPSPRRTPTRPGSGPTPRSTRATRKPRATPCARPSSTTRPGTATGCPRHTSSCRRTRRPPGRRSSWRSRRPASSTSSSRRWSPPCRTIR